MLYVRGKFLETAMKVKDVFVQIQCTITFRKYRMISLMAHIMYVCLVFLCLPVVPLFIFNYLYNCVICNFVICVVFDCSVQYKGDRSTESGAVLHNRI